MPFILPCGSQVLQTTEVYNPQPLHHYKRSSYQNNISWSDKVTNDEVLRRVDEEKSIISTIKKRQRAWLGHTLHNSDLLPLVIEGRVEGRRLLDRIKNGSSYQPVKRRAMEGNFKGGPAHEGVSGVTLYHCCYKYQSGLPSNVDRRTVQSLQNMGFHQYCRNAKSAPLLSCSFKRKEDKTLNIFDDKYLELYKHDQTE